MRWSKRPSLPLSSLTHAASRAPCCGRHRPAFFGPTGRNGFHHSVRQPFLLDLLKRLFLGPTYSEPHVASRSERTRAAMPPPIFNPDVAKPELAFLHQVLGLKPSINKNAQLQDVVFICIDCEAFEHDQKKITEVGVAVLDTKDLAATKPGEHGAGWIAKMQYAHFRPTEYVMQVNRRFVKGCEDKFAFGDTAWIHLRDAAKVMARIFQCPSRLSEAAKFNVDLPDDKRNVVFIAHGISNDDAYLAQLGFKLSQAENTVRQVDSQRVAGGAKNKALGLKRLLEELGVESQGLHNAGNDAAYTLQAVLFMAVKEHRQPGKMFETKLVPAIKLPGTVRAAGVSAPHVYGGTAKEEKVKLPINGPSHAQKTKFRNKTFKKPPTPATNNSAPAAGQLPNLPNLGRHQMKRPAPEDDGTNGPPARKKTAR